MAEVGARPAGLGEAGLVATVRDALDRLLAAGAPAGVAVSGGADSVALAHLCAAARPDVPWTVVHVRHGLRDDAADAVAAAGCAARLGLPYVEERLAVRVPPRTGVEAAARSARYEALERLAAARGLAVVCLGHTADDRAETVVLNLARGAGTGGLGPMRTTRRAGDLLLVRPLLRVRRPDLRAWAAETGLEWVEDPMNADPRFRRVRARTEVLPALARLSGGSGDPVGALSRLADLAADDHDALDALAAERAAGLVAWGPVRALPTDAVAGQPRALARRVVRILLAAAGAGAVPAADVEAVLALRPGRAHPVVGGTMVTCGQGWLAAGPVLAPLAERPLALPGRVALPEVGVALVADRGIGAPEGALVPPGRPGRAGPAWAELPDRAALAVRAPRPGDRVRARGGHPRVARLLADAGVPRPVREAVPVVVDARDEVLWVPGVAVSEPPDPPAPALRVWLAPLAGSG